MGVFCWKKEGRSLTPTSWSCCAGSDSLSDDLWPGTAGRPPGVCDAESPCNERFPSVHAAVSQPKQFLHPWLLCLSAVQRCDVALPKCLCSGVCVPFSVCVSRHIIIVLLSKRTFYDPYPLYATYLLAGMTVWVWALHGVFISKWWYCFNNGEKMA